MVTDHFEVVERTPTAITVRCGDSPRARPAERGGDGLFVISAAVDREKGEVELGVKSVFFNSTVKTDAGARPMPAHIEALHRLYSRALLASASRRVVRDGYWW